MKALPHSEPPPPEHSTSKAPQSHPQSNWNSLLLFKLKHLPGECFKVWILESVISCRLVHRKSPTRASWDLFSALGWGLTTYHSLLACTDAMNRAIEPDCKGSSTRLSYLRAGRNTASVTGSPLWLSSKNDTQRMSCPEQSMSHTCQGHVVVRQGSRHRTAQKVSDIPAISKDYGSMLRERMSKGWVEDAKDAVDGRKRGPRRRKDESLRKEALKSGDWKVIGEEKMSGATW